MKKVIILLVLSVIAISSVGQKNNLRQHFSNPSAEYGPWVFWMWMNGNATKEGITLDLEAMHRIGISGAILFTSNAGIPQGKVKYNSREWLDMNKHTFAEARRLGMKIMLHNCSGYSVTGGTWITPENSMQQVVWTETVVTGNGAAQKLNLPKPYAKLGYYEDALVVAYPSLKGENNPMQTVLKKIRVNGKEADKQKLMNFDYDSYIQLDVPEGQKQGELLFEFDQPFEASSIVIRREHTSPPNHPYDGPRDNPPVLTLEYSEDGTIFNPVCPIPMPELRELNLPTSKNFKSIKAKYYRILSNKDTQLTEVLLYTAPRLADWESKANYTVKGNRTADLQPKQLPEGSVIRPDEVQDLTGLLNPDGTLEWNAPAGNWTILRIGHTTTGEENAAAPFESAGLECDKLGKRGIQAHYNGFLKNLFEEMSEFAGTAFYGITVDSWEAGTQNWTKGFEQEYARRSQQSIVPYIAAFTGRIVGGTSSTESFLAGIRQMQATMLAENFHQQLRDYCHQYNLTFLNESYGDGPFNSLEVGKYVDIPTGEFWAHGIYGGSHTNNQAGYIARTNGRKITTAEAFTARPELGKFTEYPAEMKNMGDWMFTNGINRFAYHTYAHQPHPTARPGMTMGPFGTHFNRNQTWWEQSKSYIDYITRCQFLLQHGEFISSSSTWVPAGATIDITQKKGDFACSAGNKNAIINYIHRRQDTADYYFVCNGKRSDERIIASFDITGKQPEIWHPETGEQYPVGNYKIESGKTIIPLDMKSAESFFVVFEKAATVEPCSEIKKIETDNSSFSTIHSWFSMNVWLRPDVITLSNRSYVLYPVSGEKLYGRNHATIGLAAGQNGVRVFEQAGGRAEQVLFAETKIEGWSLVTLVYDNGKPMVYVNGKKIAEGEKSNYIVHPNDNELAQIDPLLTLFQGEYATPQIESGAQTASEIAERYKKGKPLLLLPANATNVSEVKTVWTITFPEHSGAPSKITAKELKSLHLHEHPGVKYFSGTATYSAALAIPAVYFGQNQRIVLDLGNVAFLAEVSLNGKTLPVLWKSPYSCDITKYAVQGENRLEVKVTNLWTNRLIGDELLPAENKFDKWGELDKFPDWYLNNQPYTGKRHTFVAWKQYDKDAPLTESGLIGKVRIFTITN